MINKHFEDAILIQETMDILIDNENSEMKLFVAALI